MTPLATPSPRDYLATLEGHPPAGDIAAWRARYAPLIAHVHATREDAAPSPTPPLVSVVIVAWRATDGVKDCLEHVHAQVGIAREQMQIILVDNSAGALEATLPETLATCIDLRLEMAFNVGLSPARNAGLSAAQAPLVCFLDDDGLIDPDYVRKGLDHFARDPHIVAIRSRILPLHHPYFTTLAKHYDRGDAPLDDCLVTEGSMIVRRDAYIDVGGFADELYGHEGIDLTFRLTRHDPRARVIYAPDLVMRHDYIHTWQKFLEKTSRYASLDHAPHVERSPELQRFMDAYFARRYPRSPLPPDRLLALLGLKALRSLIRGLDRLSS